MVMVLSMGPDLPSGLKETLIIPFAPAITGCLVHSGVVHPQLVSTFFIIKGILPVLVNSKTCVTKPSAAFMTPKLYDSSLNDIVASRCCEKTLPVDMICNANDVHSSCDVLPAQSDCGSSCVNSTEICNPCPLKVSGWKETNH